MMRESSTTKTQAHTVAVGTRVLKLIDCWMNQSVVNERAVSVGSLIFSTDNLAAISCWARWHIINQRLPEMPITWIWFWPGEQRILARFKRHETRPNTKTTPTVHYATLPRFLRMTRRLALKTGVYIVGCGSTLANRRGFCHYNNF